MGIYSAKTQFLKKLVFFFMHNSGLRRRLVVKTQLVEKTVDHVQV